MRKEEVRRQTGSAFFMAQCVCESAILYSMYAMHIHCIYSDILTMRARKRKKEPIFFGNRKIARSSGSNKVIYFMKS